MGKAVKGDLVKLTVAVPRTLWRAVRVRAAETDREIREVVIEALERILRDKKGGKL